jgi:hypothetical protein
MPQPSTRRGDKQRRRLRHPVAVANLLYTPRDPTTQLRNNSLEMGDGKSDIIDGYPPGFFYLRTAVRDLCPQLQSLFDLETFRSDEAVGLRYGPAPVDYANRTLWWVNPDTLQFFFCQRVGAREGGQRCRRAFGL